MNSMHDRVDIKMEVNSNNIDLMLSWSGLICSSVSYSMSSVVCVSGDREVSMTLYTSVISCHDRPAEDKPV